MAGTSLIDRYVKDLFDYALENNQLENYLKYAELIINRTDIDFDGNRYVPDEMYEFLGILPQGDANSVVSKFFDMACGRLGLLRVKIFSAAHLDFAQETAVKERLTEMFGQDISPPVKIIDKSLICGLRISVGEHTVIDNTVKTGLSEMKKNVYKEVYLK
ncbi:MAG: F0F1 ATP synthase subunit delta [Oscillospiraceae bacterium]|nr:F0F1 ATP synthase subunit delta [Oscillospiraceae bacterium]